MCHCNIDSNKHKCSKTHKQTQNALQSADLASRLYVSVQSQDLAISLNCMRITSHLQLWVLIRIGAQWLMSRANWIQRSVPFGHGAVMHPGLQEQERCTHSTHSNAHTFAHTHTHTLAVTAALQNMGNIRCCLFSMFYCWAMLERSFVQSTSILIILVFYFSMISKEML